MKNTKVKTSFAIIGFALLLLNGCDSGSVANSESQVPLKSSYIDEAVTQHHNLGWLGAKSNPVMESIAVTDPDHPDAMISPGGLVLREVTSGCAAANAGLQVGDVIIRVGENWLPIKDDPTLDFLSELETAISSGNEEIQLGILRNGNQEKVSLKHGLVSIDDGLPTDVARINDAADLAFRNLASRQNQDGSFGDSSANAGERLKVTARSGLALLASGHNDYQQHIDQCLAFVAAQVDAHSTESAPPEPREGQPESGMVMMTPPEVDLDPLTVAYVLQFLAESDVQMMSSGWMNRITGMIGRISATQSESGGWNTAEITDGETESGDVAVDVAGTHATNQILMALGAWEAKGVSGQAEILTRACGFLKSQHEARAKGNVDRRTRAALASGTAAALVAINCQEKDLFFKQLVKDSIDRSEDVLTSPVLPLSGLLTTALVARSSDKQDWIRFHNAVRVPLTAALSPDGSFHATPGVASREVSGVEASPHWRAAHLALVTGMQRGNLKRLTGQARGPMQVTRNSAGEKASGGANQAAGMPGKPPAGMMTFTMDDLSGEGSLEDQIKEKLKEMGMDADNIQVKGSTDGEKKK